MINLDMPERRRNVELNDSSISSQRQRHQRTIFDMSERSINSTNSVCNPMHKILIMDGSESSRMNDEPERRKAISPITKGWKKHGRSSGQRSFLLIFISFLCGMRLSFTFLTHYIRILSSDSTATTPYTSILYDTVQAELHDVQTVLLQEAERTSEFLRQTMNNLQSDASTTSGTQSDESQSASNVLIIDKNRMYSKYAYSYVIGGCDPNNPSYRGFLYNVLVSTRLLRDMGSTNDVVIFVQLTYSYTGGTTLPDVDVKALQGLNVQIYYIPPSPYESFYETVMNKFRVLQLTQYRRVILMDGDVMPVANLDYLFELSDDNAYGPGNSTLKPNLVVAGPYEPANAGFFMLAPEEGDYEHLCQIIERREERAKRLPDTLFDEHEGWGHIIEAPDEWVSRKNRGMNWTFHFAFSDQGLLYHWTKYVKKSVSIVFLGRVENLSADENGKPHSERVMHQVFTNYSKPLISQYGSCNKFMCDYQHFTGLLKPWLRKPPEDLSEVTKLTSGAHVWWYYLQRVDQELLLGLDFDNWVSPGRPTHGLFATWGDMMKKESFKRGDIAALS